MSTDTPAQRAAFEAWFAESRKSKGPSRRPTFERLEDGTYADDSTQRHWWTWQHAASPQPTAAQPVAWRVQVDGLWFHAREREGLIQALGVKLGISDAGLTPEPLYASAAPAQAAAPVAELVEAPSTDAAYRMGATGGPINDGERLAFEAWMRGHCWALSAAWDGKQYLGTGEDQGEVDYHAMHTRRLWAAWRDRAALSRAPGAQGGK